MSSKYTTILYEAKKKLGITLVEYIYLDTIYHLQILNGSAFATSEFYCSLLDITQRQLSRIKASLVERGLLEIVPNTNNTKLKITELYLSAVHDGVTVPKREPRKKEEKKNDEKDPMTLEEFVDTMRKSPQRHVQLIGEYAEERKPDCNTKGQWRAFTKRNLKVARQIAEFSDEQIADAFERMQKDLRSKDDRKGFITKWTFETVLKYLC